MLVRKLITVILWISFRIKKVSFAWSVKNNIERGTRIYNSGKKLSVGRAYIRSNVLISTEGQGEMTIGDDCFFNRNVVISSRQKIIIGDRSIFGPNVCIYDHDHRHNDRGVMPGYVCDDVIIGEDCWIGAGAIILKGTVIGKGSIVAAGAIVRGRFPEYSLIYSANEIKTKSLR